MSDFINEIKIQTGEVLTQLLDAAKLKEGELLVVGCSSSEVASCTIGSNSSGEIGKAIFEVLNEELKKRGIYLVTQCCEHLNRALIMEAEAAAKYGYEPVNVIPQLKAGGSFSTAAYAGFENPVAVEHVQAHAGIDIGDTLIGMHLRSVAVPVRTKTDKIGGAHVVCARTRLKFIGGVRAIYRDV